MKRYSCAAPMLMLLVAVFFSCTKTQESLPPVSNNEGLVSGRILCNIEFTAEDFLVVCGTRTNLDACGVCGNPNLGKLRGVESHIKQGSYVLNSDDRIQFTNQTGNAVALKIKDGNGLVQGYSIPNGMRLVVVIDANCDITTSILC